MREKKKFYPPPHFFHETVSFSVVVRLAEAKKYRPSYDKRYFLYSFRNYASFLFSAMMNQLTNPVAMSPSAATKAYTHI